MRSYSALHALETWMRWGLWVFALVGGLWVLKIVFITLNDAMGRSLDALPVPILYLSGILLMVVGATAVGIALLRRFPCGRSWSVPSPLSSRSCCSTLSWTGF